MCARIKYTALVDNIRGSIGGTTFQRNAYGYTVKSKPNMVNPNSNKQRQRKGQFSVATQLWKQIDPADRTAWDAYAETFPIPTRLNPDSYLNGFNAFVRWHGLARTVDAGALLPDPSGDQGTVDDPQPSISVDAGVLTWIDNSNPTEGPWTVILYLSRPLSPTQRYVKSWTRIMSSGVAGTTFANDITAAYITAFGSLPVVGNILAARMAFYNTTNGQIFYNPAYLVELEPV